MTADAGRSSAARAAAGAAQGASRPARPVKPSPAAGLFLLRRIGSGPDDYAVLMGRRSASARFMPNRWVTPGGRIDAADHAPTGFLEPLAPDVARRFPSPRQALAAARTALRETWEETGLLVGTPTGRPASPAERPPDETDAAAPPDASWRAFAAAGLAPAFGALRYGARAITPTFSPIRFDTRFFWALDAPVAGRIVGNGELEDLAWLPLPEARRLPMPDVTEFMLAQAVARARDPAAEPATGLLFRYRNRGPWITADIAPRRTR